MSTDLEVEWDVPCVVRLSPAARRAMARRIGKRGLISRKAFEAVVTELVFNWIHASVCRPCAEESSR